MNLSNIDENFLYPLLIPITMRVISSFITLSLGLCLCMSAQSQSLNWAVEFGQCSATNPGPTMVVDSQGNIVNVDIAYGPMDIDPGPEEFLVDGGGFLGMGNLYLSKLDASGNFLGGIEFVGATSYYYSADVDQDNNIYVATNFDVCDFDPGPGEVILESPGEGSNSIFVAKYSPALELIWVRIIEASQGDYEYITTYDLETDSEGSVTVAGYFSGSIDADPSEAEHLLTSENENAQAGFAITLTADGELANALPFNGEMFSGVYNIATFPQEPGRLVVEGHFSGTLDLDPGPGEYLIEAAEQGPNMFVASYTNGVLDWGHVSLGQYIAWGSGALVADDESNIYRMGYYYGTVDFDPGPGEVWSAPDSFGWYIAKYASDGSLLWASHQESGTLFASLAIDQDGHVVAAGSGYGDIDPGPGIHMADGGFYIAQYSAEAGHLISAMHMMNAEEVYMDDWTYDVRVAPDNSIVVSGLYQGTIDLGAGEDVFIFETEPSTWPNFIASYSQDPCDALVVHVDAVSDVSCESFEGSITTSILSGAEPFDIAWSDGSSDLNLTVSENGLYTVTVTDGNGCVRQAGAIVGGPETEGADVESLMFTWSNFVPGFATDVVVSAVNLGCAAASGVLSFTLDPGVTFVSAEPEPDFVDGNVLSWNYSDLLYNGADFQALVQLYTSEVTELGTVFGFTLNADVQNVADDDLSNNSKNFEYVVVGAYDPNDKQVFPQGSGEEGYILADQELTYTVRFQNTGTAPAVNVYILDEIDTDLQLGTLEVLESSHDMFTEVLDNNTVKFRFDNIMLPDSTNNEPESHGFVTYRISMQAGLQPGEEITNTAAIYFDFNAPIITNTVLNTIAFPVGIAESAAAGFNVYPSPAQEQIQLQIAGNWTGSTMRIFAANGAEVSAKVLGEAPYVVNVADLSTGVYFAVITDREGQQMKTRFTKE